MNQALEESEVFPGATPSDWEEHQLKPAPFEYLAPESLEEAVSLLSEKADDAKVLAGGQSLIPLMALRLSTPAALLDLNKVRELDYLHDDGDGLRIGALARNRAVELLPDLKDRSGMVAEALELVGHVAIRNRGTVVGSLAHADPAAEWPALALALDAEIDAVGPKGKRTIPAEHFYLNYFTTTLEPDEIATEVRFALPLKRVGSSFQELARRHGDFAVAGAGALLAVSRNGAIESARIVLIGVSSTVVRIREAEDLIIGHEPSAALYREAAEIVHKSIDPTGDIHGSAEYRRTLALTLSRRALHSAGHRALGGSNDD